jgi:nucleoside 2-deoxyribosyltransferase
LGSGDIFSSVFSYYWMICEKDPSDAAQLASRAVAVFSDNNSIIPLPKNYAQMADEYEDFYLPNSKCLDDKTIYLAGPFFSLHEKWIIEECHRILENLGFNVFSPMHDVGILGNDISEEKLQEVVEEDLEEIDSCDAILAILDNYDPGTSFELGYGVKHDLPTHIILHSTSSVEITMFEGSQCKLHDDFSTALFSLAWDICT